MNEITTLNQAQVPAYLQNRSADTNNALTAGISAGFEGLPQLSIRGGKFHTVIDDNDQVLLSPEGSAASFADVIIFAARPAVSKRKFAGKFNPDVEPVLQCSSLGGVTPDSGTAIQSQSCSLCPHNVYGSSDTGKGKACGEYKHVVLAFHNGQGGLWQGPDGKVMLFYMDIPATSLKSFREYVALLTAHNAPLGGVVTRLTFDPNVTWPQLKFTNASFLTQEAFMQVEELSNEQSVKDEISIEQSTATPAPTGAPVPNVPVDTGHPAPTTPAPAPVPSPVPGAVPASAPSAPAPQPAPAPSPAPMAGMTMGEELAQDVKIAEAEAQATQTVAAVQQQVQQDLSGVAQTVADMKIDPAKMKKAELVELGKEVGAPVTASMKKEDLVATVQSHLDPAPEQVAPAPSAPQTSFAQTVANEAPAGAGDVVTSLKDQLAKFDGWDNEG